MNRSRPPAEPKPSQEERLASLEREHARVLEGLAAGERRLRGVARSVWRVQEEERRRLARELHDGLGQTLTALRLRLDQVRLDLEPRDPVAAAQLAELWEAAGSVLAEAREIARSLRPPVLDDLGLAAALAWIARRFGETGLNVRLEVSGLERPLDGDLEIAVFRIAQEALNNVLKHSGVREARLTVTAGAEECRVRCSDAGRGFDPAAVSGGFGLHAMRDRVESFGGRFASRSAPGAGTEISATFPRGDAAFAKGGS